MNPKPTIEPLWDGFNLFVHKILRDWKVPGMGITVIKEDDVLFSKRYGYRDREDGPHKKVTKTGGTNAILPHA